jgi:hypothetical protein
LLCKLASLCARVFQFKTDPNPKINQKDEHIFNLKSLAGKESKQTGNQN